MSKTCFSLKLLRHNRRKIVFSLLQSFNSAHGGLVVRGGGKKAVTDVFLVLARDGGLAARLKVAMDLGADYWLQALVDWVLRSFGAPRYRPMLAWSWLNIIGSIVVQARCDDGDTDGEFD